MDDVRFVARLEKLLSEVLGESEAYTAKLEMLRKGNKRCSLRLRGQQDALIMGSISDIHACVIPIMLIVIRPVVFPAKPMKDIHHATDRRL